MKRDYLLWVTVMMLGLHFLEEVGLDFVGWMETTIVPHAPFVRCTWTEFHLLNGAYLLYAIGAAVIGWRWPAVALSSPALLAINGLFFHLGGSIVTWSFSPGVVTGLALFLPAAAAGYYGAWKDGVLTRPTLVWSIVIGVLLTLYPFGMLLMRHYIRPLA